MQILHYCARLRLVDGGVVRAVLDITSALAGRGKNVILLHTEGTDCPPASSHVQTMQTGPFDKAPIRFSQQRLESLKQHIEDADVLHLHTPWEPANIQLAKLAYSCGTPYIISVHGMLDDWVMKTSAMKKKLFLLLGGRRMFNRASAVHCTAEAEASQVKKRIPKATIIVAPYVFNPEEYLHPPPTSDPDKYWPVRGPMLPTVLFLSRIHPKKGVDRFIRAAGVVCKTHDARFIIAGSGEVEYERELRLLVEEEGIQNNVEFVGFVGGDRKTSLYRVADIFAVPTSQENFGIVFPEAMACGVPVITTRGVDIWPELEGSGGAQIIQEDVQSTANAIKHLLDNAELRNQMGAKGRQWVDHTFSGDAVVNRYIELYRSVGA